MFRAHCPAEGRDVLLSIRRITAIRSSADEVEIDFTCWCGATGSVVEPRRTGRPTEARPSAVPAAVEPSAVRAHRQAVPTPQGAAA